MDDAEIAGYARAAQLAGDFDDENGFQLYWPSVRRFAQLIAEASRNDALAGVELWHARARPQPTERDFSVQLGCHLEEVTEMLRALAFALTDSSFPETLGAETSLYTELASVSLGLKLGTYSARITDRAEFLDSVADQVVTGVGAAYCAGMRPAQAVRRVDASNWSKFVQGEPLRDENGKISKGPHYVPPDLDGLH